MGDVSVRMINAQINYGYEYLGGWDAKTLLQPSARFL